MSCHSRKSVAARPVGMSTLLASDEDALVEVLRAAQAARVLASLASTSRQLCLLARSRVPLHFHITSQAQATLVLRSQARGNLPFSSCTQLCIEAEADLYGCFLAVCVLGAAQPWAGLQQLHLHLRRTPRLEHGYKGWDFSMLGVMSSLSGLKQLQQLALIVPCIDGFAARHIAQLVQLTSLQLHMWDEARPAPLDLSALSQLSRLQRFKIRSGLHVQPAAAAGPYSFPSSLTYLDIQDCGGIVAAAPMAGWVTHLPGCQQLQQLVLKYRGVQHPGAHPQALAGILGQHHRQLRGLALEYHALGVGWENMRWDAPVPGLPAAPGPADSRWRPDASLAALTGLECVSANDDLCITNDAEWHYLAQLSALTKLVHGRFYAAPAQQAGVSLAVLELHALDHSIPRRLQPGPAAASLPCAAKGTGACWRALGGCSCAGSRAAPALPPTPQGVDPPGQPALGPSSSRAV